MEQGGVVAVVVAWLQGCRKRVPTGTSEYVIVAASSTLPFSSAAESARRFLQ